MNEKLNKGLVAVTGAAGHIGANLVRELLKEGIRPRVLVHHDMRAVEGLDVEVVRGDVLDRDSLEKCFEGVDVVFHLAGHVSISGGEGGKVGQINIEGTRNVVEACFRKSVRRLVHFSSIHALNPFPEDKPVDESNPLVINGKCHLYDIAKAEGERIVLKSVLQGLDAVVLNPTGVLGPYDFKPSHMGQVLMDLCRGNFPALVKGGFDWVDARDVAQGAISAAVMGRKGERYILSGRYASVVEIAKLVEKFTGKRAPSLILPLWLADVSAPFVTAYSRIRGRRPIFTTEAIQNLRWNPNILSLKAEKEIGYRKRPLEETIEDTVKWFIEAGLL